MFFLFNIRTDLKGHTDGESGDYVGCADQIGVAGSRDDAGTGRCGCAWAVCRSGIAGGTVQRAWTGRWICGWAHWGDGCSEYGRESAASAAVFEVRLNYTFMDRDLRLSSPACLLSYIIF